MSYRVFSPSAIYTHLEFIDAQIADAHSWSPARDREGGADVLRVR